MSTRWQKQGAPAPGQWVKLGPGVIPEPSGTNDLIAPTPQIDGEFATFLVSDGNPIVLSSGTSTA